MINLKLNAWTFAQITPKKEKENDKEKGKRSQEEVGELRWVGNTWKSEISSKVGQVFWWIYQIGARREIYKLATNCSISMGFLEAVGRAQRRPVQCETANFQLN